MFNTDDYTFFVLDDAFKNNASFGFRAAYTDRQGDFHKLTTHQLDKSTGEKMIRKFTIQKGHKTLRVHNSRTEELEFLRNHPNCKGSPNGAYRPGSNGEMLQLDVWFSEVNTERDAAKAVEWRTLRIDAQNKILELAGNDQDLIEFGTAIGYLGTPKVVMFSLFEHAEKDPQYILEEINSPDMKAKSLYREGVSKGILQRKGISYMLEDFEIGVDDDSCIKTIKTNEDVAKLLKKKLGRGSEESQEETEETVSVEE